MTRMADLCATVLVVLGVAWVVRRVMDGPVRQPLTAVRRRCWVFLSLLSAVAAHGVLAGLDLIPWRNAAIPATLLGIWLVLCRVMVRPRRGAPGSARRSAVFRRLSPATLALTVASILACWIAVNPMGERPDEAVAATTATRAPVHTPRESEVAQVGPVAPVISQPNGYTTHPGLGAANHGSSPVAPPAHGATGATQPDVPAAAASRRGAGPIVMANRGAIIYVGDNGRLTANTGATSSSGAVALGVKGSDLSSGDSGDVAGATHRRGAVGRSRRRSLGHENGTVAELVKRGKGPRGTALSGFEDHSVSVAGDDQIVTYDDSNVFIDRKGLINANTGDTDSSGLNAVDVGRSTVRAGNSGDSEGGGDGEAEEEEAASPSTTNGQRKLPGSRVASPAGAPASAPDEDDAEEDAGEGGDDAAGVGPARGQAYGSVTDEGASTATGKNAFVVGADGIDDVSIRSHGRNDIVTYDDSNVTIGGEGKVNAQIGDSDTGGGVVMGIHDSDVRAGCEGDLCYSANPAIAMAAQVLGSSGVRLTPAQRRQLVGFATTGYSSGQSLREHTTPHHPRGRAGRR
jgi:hypothetical protein